MINLFATNSYHSGARYIHSCLSQVDQSKLDTRHIVIVPDRCSLEAERQMLATVGGSFNIVVLTFRRLAAKILPQYQYLSKQAGVVAMSAIIDDLQDSMRCYTKGTKTIGFAENMYDTISQLKYCQIPASRLLDDSLPRSVADKLHDIGLIYGGYQSFMQDRYIDSADKLDLLCSSIADNQYCRDSHFYLYDFDNLTAQELSILSQLVKHSRGVTVACTMSDKPQDRYLYSNDIYNSVLQMCRDISVTPHVICDSYHTHPITQHIGTQLYRYTPCTHMSGGDFVDVFEGNSVVNEVYQLGCMVARHVRNGGRYRDIYAITSNVDSYANAIHTVFGQLGIPYFCDQQYCLAHHIYSQLVIDYLSMCSHRLQIGYVHSIVKNPLMQYGDGAYDFVNYTNSYNINYRLDAFTLGVGTSNYAVAESIRAQLYSLYNAVDMPTAGSASLFVDKIRLLISTLQLGDRVVKFADMQSAGQLHQLSKVSMQVDDKLDEVLSSIVDVLGDRQISLDDMILYLTNGLSAVNISVLPTHSDSVIFANMAKSRKHDIQVLAVLGANQGLLPMTHKDTKLLTDYNIAIMQDCGMAITPDSLTENRGDRFALFQLLCEPSSRLHISYCCSVGGESVLPSSFVGNIRQIFGSKKQLLPLSQPDHSVYSHRQALSRVVSGRQALQDRQIVNDAQYSQLLAMLPEAEQYGNNVDMQSITIDNGSQLMMGSGTSSISKITQLYSCPYKFYHMYGLAIKPIDKAELDASIIGDILHNVLELYLANGGDAGQIFDRILTNDRYRAIFADPAVKHKLRRLREEAIKMSRVVADQLADSNFSCCATEMQFGGKGDVAPVAVPYNGGTLYLTGKIDRVDRWGDMFIVVDYKSGASVDYSDLGLYRGDKLQLLVYLQAVMEHYQWKPAGFYYFQLHNDFDKGEVYKYIGRTLADDAVIRALDKSGDGVSARFHIAKTKKGVYTAHSYIVTADGMDRQIQYAQDMIAQAGNLMSGGYIAMTPYDEDCKFCDYKDICDYGDVYTHKSRKLGKDAVKGFFGGRK